MSIALLHMHNIYRIAAPGSGGGTTLTDPYTPEKWVRPSDWPAMPTIGLTEHKVAALVMVKDGLNLVSVKAAGDFTVDWGDGTTENFSANTVAWHVYDYAATLPSCSRGYKTAMMVITPQAGHVLSSLSFIEQSGHAYAASFTSIETGLLDLLICGPSLTELKMKNWQGTYDKVQLSYLERVVILKSQIPWAPLDNLLNLRYVSIQNSPTIELWSYTFEGCVNLVEVGTLDTAAGTDLSYMFVGCVRLDDIPTLDLSSALTVSNMFSGCEGLRTVPNLSMPLVTDASGMFNGCVSMRTCDSLSLPNATTLASLFSGCSLLTTVPTVTAPLATDFSYMFENCKSIEAAPSYDLTAAVDVRYMFSGCEKLRTSPAVTIPTGCLYSEMFYGCASLEEIVFNCTVTNHADLASAFYACSNLRKITGLTFALTSTSGEIFSKTWSLQTVGATGLDQNVTFQNIPISRESLTYFCNALQTVATGSRRLTLLYPPNTFSSPTHPFPSYIQADFQSAINKGWEVALNTTVYPV